MADQLAPGPVAHESGRYNGYRPLIRGRTSVRHYTPTTRVLVVKS